MARSKNDIVKHYIQNQIQKKMYCEGQLIASEGQLCELLNVSRMTVRKALDELTNEGVIFKEKGRGTFVAKQPKFANLRCGVSFSQEVLKRGMNPSSQDVQLQLLIPPKEIAEKLNISADEKIWEVTRIRCADDEPVIFVKEYYLYKLCPDLTLDIAQQSIYEHLDKKNISFAFADQKLEAVSATKEMATKLNIPIHHPLIKMNTVVYMKNGIAFNCGIEYYCTDRFAIMQPVYCQK